MSLETVLQVYIAITSCLAISLLARLDAGRRWGFVAGLAGQPAWIWSTLQGEQFGILLVTAFFTWVYARGVWFEFFAAPVVHVRRGR